MILVVGATAVWSGHPWLFASLGPTAYELAEKPELRSARTYNVIVGQFVGIGAGFAAVAILGAWNAPSIDAHSPVVAVRLWTAVIAVFLTVLLNLMLKAGQPAALATTLLIALGMMQTAYSALWLAIGVVLLAIIGEPIRRIRLNALEGAGKLPHRQQQALFCPAPRPKPPLAA